MADRLPPGPRQLRPPASEAARREPWGFVVAVAGGWLCAVLAILARHEFWRDEVRALSIATRTPSIAALLAELRLEGHPALWYLLLRAAHTIVPSPRVLPALSVLVALAAVVLLLRSAPFPHWLKVLLVLGVAPLYEYAVVARNYGLGLLGLFAWAACWPSRARRPLRLGVVLALLANTSAHAAVLSAALLGAWGLDGALRTWRAHGDADVRMSPSEIVGLVIGAFGLLACALTIRPAPDLAVLADPSTRGLLQHVLASAPALLDPGAQLGSMFGLRLRGQSPAAWTALTGWLAALYVWAMGIALFRRRGVEWMAFATGVGGLLLLFAGVYPASLRHTLLVTGLGTALAWTALVPRPAAAPGRRPGERTIVALVAAAAVLHLAMMAVHVRRDWVETLSGAGALAEWLGTQPALAGAALVAEPYYTLEALPYVMPAARIYLPREHAWRAWSRFTRQQRDRLTLDDLLAEGTRVRRETGRPVVLLLDETVRAGLLADSSGEVRVGYGQRFAWTAAMRARWDSATVHRAAFTRAEAETWTAYTLKEARTP